jgi:hypothetical protein
VKNDASKETSNIQDSTLTEQELGKTEYHINQTPEEVQQDITNAQAFIRKDEEDERTPRLFF